VTEPLLDVRARGVLRDIAWLEDTWEDLLESRIPGTARPWREPTLSPEQRERADQLAQDERAARGPDAIGEAPAPVHVDVLDVLSELLMTFDLLHEHMAQVVGRERLPSAPSAYADPSPYLRFVAQNLAAAMEADPEILDAVSDKCRTQVEAVSVSLSLLRDGQTLKAPCPFCRGVTPHTPGGGSFTLRVRMIRDPRAGSLPGDEVAAVVCHNDTCTPPDAECGNRHRGRPAWPDWEWSWLAEKIDRAAA
jgi:hypothetical protein